MNEVYVLEGINSHHEYVPYFHATSMETARVLCGELHDKFTPLIIESQELERLNDIEYQICVAKTTEAQRIYDAFQLKKDAYGATLPEKDRILGVFKKFNDQNNRLIEAMKKARDSRVYINVIPTTDHDVGLEIYNSTDYRSDRTECINVWMERLVTVELDKVCTR